MRWSQADLDAYQAKVKGAIRIQTLLKKPDPPKEVKSKALTQPQNAEEKINNTEREWLGILRRRDFVKVAIHDHTLRIGDTCRYTPDFRTIDSEGTTTFFEVKGGFIRDVALVKLKIVARMFPEYKFVMAQKKKGEWTETHIKP